MTVAPHALEVTIPRRDRDTQRGDRPEPADRPDRGARRAERASQRGVHVLHISKTGGTTVRTMFKTAGITTTGDGRPIVLNHHQTTMPDVLGQDEGNEVTFFLRHPVPRFVSGFNSRLRQGAPSHDRPWRPEEKVVFDQFGSANELAEALSSTSLRLQDRAISAMRALNHTRWRTTDWLISPEYLEPRLDRVRFVGFQETFAEDVAALLVSLGVTKTLPLQHEHQAPTSSPTELSESAQSNLTDWYARDLALYEWALERRGRWHAGAA